ncbi:hypothetical protein H6P81_018684 [Aristolochia fimbriata]|uniref:Reverse transcriptase zinc-binding domain-containing protein n=1 Tax=Aristolochia fimbriata TaxID=158543 RepID=A0AAV7E1Q6_ARIFI|nr:hypothetical protein H6P81_018684 [Aristolochia fimbriata]
MEEVDFQLHLLGPILYLNQWDNTWLSQRLPRFKGQEVGWLSGMGVHDVRIPILQFADDTLILCEGMNESLLHAKALLCLFEIMSGQNINWAKSGVFSVNCSTAMQDQAAFILGCNCICLPSTYLGLPLFHVRNNKALWQPILEKYQRRLESWKGQLLSQAGRATLIKATLAERDFVEKLIASKYGTNSLDWLPKDRVLASPISKAIMRCKKKVLSCFRFHVKEGNNVRFWQDEWIRKETLAQAFPSIYQLAYNKDITVAECKTEANRSWNLNLRGDLNETELSEVTKLHGMLDSTFLSGVGVDEIIWSLSENGLYSEASCYKLLLNTEITTLSFQASFAWKLPVPQKIKQFVWTASHSKILTCDQLQRRGQIITNPLCKLCNSGEEDCNHLLPHCKFSQKVWDNIRRKFGIYLCMPKTFGQLIEQWYPCPLPLCGQILWRTAIVATSWQLWVERNAITFNNQCCNLGGVIEKVIHNFLLWAGASNKLPPLPSSIIRMHWSKVIHSSTYKQPTMEEWNPPPLHQKLLNSILMVRLLANRAKQVLLEQYATMKGPVYLHTRGQAAYVLPKEAEALALLTV